MLKMKTKLTYCLMAIAAVMIFCGCEGGSNYAEPKRGGFYLIDTLAIHGEPHEIIRECTNYRGGIMHSPECWCGKGGGR